VSDKSFTTLLNLLKDMLSEANELPDHIYDTKKILCSIDINYKSIHTCPNDYILYRKNYESLKRCQVCEVDRYKKNKNKISAKVLCYFMLLPRCKHMFRNSEHAKSLIWHSDERISDNMLRHLTDSLQWNMIDSKFLDFRCDARNPQLSLSSDGMNPQGNMSNTYNTWLVVLSIYNLPLWLCMKHKYDVVIANIGSQTAEK